MKDYALTSLIRRILACKTKGEATEILGNVGDEYSPIVSEILARLTFARTKSQNNLLHEWYAEIAQHYGDRSALDVKGQCHRDLGLHIRLRDPQFDWVWKHTGELMDHEQQARLLVSGCLNFSSEMSVKELSEYMDEIARFYEEKGVRLTRPGE
jgi:hypothetical protein